MRVGLRATVAVAAALAAGCSSDDGGSDLGTEFSVSAALAEIPLAALETTDGLIQVVAADLDAAGEVAGVDRPSNPTDRDELIEFLGPMTGLARDDEPMRVFVPLPQMFTGGAVPQLGEFVAELGFSPGDVSTYVALESPPAMFMVATGVMAPTTLPEVAPGVTTVGEGDDFQVAPEERTAARPLGRPLRLAESDGRLGLSFETAPLIDWLAGSDGGTLAEDAVCSAIAGRLDEKGVVSAFVVGDESAPYVGVGLGWTADGDGALGVIVFGFESEGLAEDNLGRIEGTFDGDSSVTGQPMSDLLTVDSIEVRGAQVVAVVRFPGGRPPQTTFDMLVRRDGPFALG